VPGSFSVGSHEVWGEAPIVPPMRLASDGKIIPEVERLLLRNTRAPELAKVNMRVRMAAAHVGAERLERLVAKYGVDRIRIGQEQIITHVATTLRQRLSSVPDGSWRERVWLDHDGVDPVHLQVMTTLTKRGDRLVVDFDGTDAQTKGGVNCTRPGLEGAVVSAMFSMLCFDLPWSTAGVREVVEIRSEPGTMNDALFPAAVSMASISGAWVTCRVVNGAIGKMLACSVALAQESQAMWNPAFHGVIFAGTDDQGSRVTFFPLDQEAGGGGARSDGDGIDAGSNLHSISNAIPNVERNEQLYPVLQVWRRLLTDSGGAGEHRGGCGIEILYLPNEVTFPMEAIVFSSGDDQPGAMGLYGGYPGSVQRHVVIRDSDVFAQFADGRVPTDAAQVKGAQHEVLAPKTRTLLQRGDAHWAFLAGGGGFGDPLDRRHALVRDDVRDGLVSRGVATGLYGVDLSADGGADGRAALKRERLEAASPPRAPALDGDGADPRLRYPIGSRLSVVSAGDGEGVACSCGQLLARLPDDPKTGCAHRVLPLSAGSPLNAYGREDLFVLREYLCPGCGSLVGTQVCPVDEEGLFADTEIEPGHEPA
jgi:N-methylhydantoinase B